MTKRTKNRFESKPIWVTIFGLLALSCIVGLLLQGKDVMLLNPKGHVANEQLRLLITSTLIMLEIAIPSLFLLYYFAWRYRESNDRPARSSESKHGILMSIAVWGLPFITAVLLAIVLVPATFNLQPQQPIEGKGEPMKIQVVALRWKWLFIYPEQNIATVNYAQIPVHQPVEFELTADQTPMSSFWIPHLGGMLYAMTEHVNRLNLVAEETGDFEGSAAEINGAGFSAMRFNTRVSSQDDFDSWVEHVKSSAGTLTKEDYQALLQPSENNQPAFFSNPDPDIYSTILGKYGGSHSHENAPAHYEGGH